MRFVLFQSLLYLLKKKYFYFELHLFMCELSMKDIASVDICKGVR